MQLWLSMDCVVDRATQYAVNVAIYVLHFAVFKLDTGANRLARLPGEKYMIPWLNRLPGKCAWAKFLTWIFWVAAGILLVKAMVLT